MGLELVELGLGELLKPGLGELLEPGSEELLEPGLEEILEPGLEELPEPGLVESLGFSGFSFRKSWLRAWLVMESGRFTLLRSLRTEAAQVVGSENRTSSGLS